MAGTGGSFDGRSGEQPQGLAGIGLLMQQDGGSSSTVFIKHIVPNGACSRDGVIQVGDAVVGVNGENVMGYAVAEIRERIVGPIGSTVRVAFQREGENFERSLVRGNAQFDGQANASAHSLSRSLDARGLSASLSALPAGQASDSEIARLRSRVGELESELTICRDELQRTRALLDSDKMSSMRYVKEIDTVQRRTTEQGMELQNMLNQSEQARRELELQVQAGKSREEEFHSAFARAKEQTEAREIYFAELKRKFADLQQQFDGDMAKERQAKEALEAKVAEGEASVARVKAEVDRFKEAERTRREKEEGIRRMLHEAEAKLTEAKQVEDKVRSQGQQLHLLFAQWQKDFFVNKSREEAELEQYFLA